MSGKAWPKEYDVSAYISECGLYRYSMRIQWNFDDDRGLDDAPLRFMGLFMLNPSIASHLISDPTAKRGVGFAKREGFDGLLIGNPYAFRATKPKDLFKAIDPIGPENFIELYNMLLAVDKAVVGWGANLADNRAREDFLNIVDRVKIDLYCLGRTKSGEPRHPLYLRSDTKLELWRGATR